MITEDYVSFEIAKLLKDRGFDEKCRASYNKDGNFLFHKNCYFQLECGDGYLAPTLHMACKWLREVYNVVIEINSIWIVGFGYNYIARVVVEGESKKCLKHYNYYEEAVEAALKYSLENLI